MKCPMQAYDWFWEINAIVRPPFEKYVLTPEAEVCQQQWWPSGMNWSLLKEGVVYIANSSVYRAYIEEKDSTAPEVIPFQAMLVMTLIC